MRLQGLNRVALVVDDEPFARLSALQVLIDQAYHVLEAADAAEAFDLIERNDDISVVVTDINMPGSVDGLTMARHLRSRQPDLALVVASGAVRPALAELPEGAEFLQKPYAAQALLRCVRDAVEAADRHCFVTDPVPWPDEARE